MVLTLEEKNYLADRMYELNHERADELCTVPVPKDSFYTRYGKRILDIGISLPACIVTLPINLVLGICTYFDVGRPIFYLQKRPGKDGKLFTLVKFRNMRIAKDKNGYDLPISQRVTKFGSFVRATSLDELLNFYSVLKGDMSIIGPRPVSAAYERRYSKRHIMRHCVRPGLECPDLKAGGYSEGWNNKLENDIWYVENVSFPVDCKMIMMLFKMVFDKETRKKHAVPGVGDFIGYDENGVGFGSNEIPEKYLHLLDTVEV